MASLLQITTEIVWVPEVLPLYQQIHSVVVTQSEFLLLPLGKYLGPLHCGFDLDSLNSFEVFIILI